MKKFKIFWNFKEEENWLADMARNGHILRSYSTLGIYTFADETPQNLSYKIDYKLFIKKSDYISYLALFEDAGWQHIWGTKHSGSHYFLSKNKQSGTEIFSDAESANKRYKTLFQICIANLVAWAVYCTALLYVNDFNFPNLVFLTPGLWDKVGVAFWKSFLFELPFAVGRVGLWFILLVMGISYGYWAIKAKKEYDAYVKENDK
ncbi:MAG: DUF2812 domain-containing protein [Velocimicrobium sp.]